MREFILQTAPPIGHLGKRITDVCLASLMLLLCGPALAVFAILIRLSSSGPILFRQPRIASNGRTFIMFKLRSLEQNEDNVPFSELKKRGKIRYIKIFGWNLGVFLRRYRIDEIVQGLNVLKGEMSMVGLRPALATEPILPWRIENGFANFPVGMTGLYQIGGSKDVDEERRQELEREQCLSWSYLEDLRILYQTFDVVRRRKGAGE